MALDCYRACFNSIIYGPRESVLVTHRRSIRRGKKLLVGTAPCLATQHSWPLVKYVSRGLLFGHIQDFEKVRGVFLPF